MKITKYLVEHDSIGKVYYPELDDHPSYELMTKTATGYGGMISFDVGSEKNG